MALTDIILFPVYVLVFHLLFSIRRKRIDDPVLKKYHRQGFWIKVMATIAFTLFHIFITIGDTTILYYPEGINIARLILKDPANISLLFSPGKDFDMTLLASSLSSGYFKSEGNYFVIKLVSISSFFSFGSYAVINLFFSMLSFSGVWRLYKFFYEQYPKLHRQLAIAIIYLPTFVFWSGGILKDPLCTGMLGWLTYSLYCAIIKKQSVVKNILAALVASYILAVVKSYILAAYLPFFISYIVFAKLKIIKRMAVKLTLLFSILLIVGIGILAGEEALQNFLGNLALDKLSESVKATQENFEGLARNAESSFSLGVEFDGTPASLAKIAPAAILATLFRPFLWESKKIPTLLSSLESLAFMFFTLYVLIRAGPFRFLKSIFADPIVVYSFWFSVLFAVFIGATTLNFGTLVRYKIPCIPFYLISLILILDKRKEKKSSTAVAASTALK
jgi:hypothetical protein